MKNGKRYYAVAGSNAYGVMDDYERALAVNVYVRNFKVKKFSSFKDAKEYAEDMYLELQKEPTLGRDIDEIEKINWIYYKKREQQGDI